MRETVSLGFSFSKLSRGLLGLEHSQQGHEHTADGIAQHHDGQIDDGIEGEEHSRRAEVEHIGHRMLKARQNEDGDAEQDARDGLLVAVDAHRHVHEDAAEDAADQGLPPLLGQAGGAEDLGHAPR